MAHSEDVAPPTIVQLNNQVHELLGMVSSLQEQLYLRERSGIQHGLGRLLQKPPEYDGKDRKECHTYISHLKHFIAGNYQLFPDGRSKVTFAVSFLRGRAFSWFDPYLSKPAEPINADFDLFCQELIKNLGDPDRHRTLTRELLNLKQTGSAAAYTAQFYQVSAFLEWNDQALSDQYYTGLKSEVKDALAYSNENPATLKLLSDLAIRLDNRLFDRKADKASVPSARSSTATPRVITSPAPRVDTPMDIDGIYTRKFKPLTDDEKKRRRDLNLCMYCGAPGHKAGECPKKSSPARIRATLGSDSQVSLDLGQTKND